MLNTASPCLPRDQARTSPHTDPLQHLRIRLDAGPGALPALTNLMAKLDILPARMAVERGGDGATLDVTLALDDPPGACDRLAHRLGGLIMVRAVTRP